MNGPMRTASTLRQPEPRPLPGGMCVRVTYYFHDREVTVSGLVDGDEVRSFVAEDDAGRPYAIPHGAMSEVLQDLPTVIFPWRISNPGAEERQSQPLPNAA